MREQQQEDVCGPLWRLRQTADPQPEQRGGAGAVPHRGAHEHIRLLRSGKQTFTALIYLFSENIICHFLKKRLTLSVFVFLACVVLSVTEPSHHVSLAITKTPASPGQKTVFSGPPFHYYFWIATATKMLISQLNTFTCYCLQNQKRKKKAAKKKTPFTQMVLWSRNPVGGAAGAAIEQTVDNKTFQWRIFFFFVLNTEFVHGVWKLCGVLSFFFSI